MCLFVSDVLVDCVLFKEGNHLSWYIAQPHLGILLLPSINPQKELTVDVVSKLCPTIVIVSSDFNTTPVSIYCVPLLSRYSTCVYSLGKILFSSVPPNNLSDDKELALALTKVKAVLPFKIISIHDG